MFKFVIVALLSLVASSSAFMAPKMMKSRVSAMSMSAKDLNGVTSPLGFFDPLGLSEGKTDEEMKKIREAELKHGRVAMLAFLGIMVGEKFNPFFDGQITGPAIYQFQQADDIFSYFWEAVLFTIALVEGQNIIGGWGKMGKNGIAGLKPEYVNGDLGFDPLGLQSKFNFDEIRTKELNNGRLAMIGVAGIVVQELVNGKTVYETLGL